MKTMFKEFSLGNLKLINRFVFPPLKLGYGNPDGTVSAPLPGEEIRKCVPVTEVIGDAEKPQDVFTAMQSGYQLAQSY